MKILDIATAEIGYLEKKSNANLDDKTANAGSANYTKYWRDIYPAFQAQPWCACFVVWCARQTGLTVDIVPSLYSCAYMRDWYKTRSRWYTRAQGAMMGDLIIFGDTNGNPSHIGLVSKVDNGKVYTIEGNTSSAAGVVANGGCVAAKSYDASYSRIFGYCRPDYPVELDEISVTINNAVEDIAMNSAPYWESVLRGKTTTSAENVKALMDKYHTALVAAKGGKT